LAGPLLFDVASLDLENVVVSAEEVGRINPQCGAMRQLDHVIWLSEDRRRGMGVKLVSHDEFWVPYHIPGRPIMPGVLMIEAAAQMSSVLFRMKLGRDLGFLGFTRCDDVVFRGQVVPGDRLHLLASEVRFRPRRFVSRTQGLVGEQVVFEATITGMAI
jgi:3-hydroxyacyl-[acyl-carrier-protein] dehydratase